MDCATATVSRIGHGNHPFFKSIAPRIEAVVPSGTVPILTRGALGLEPVPKRYWFYNTEDLHLARKRTAQYMALLDGAERVFDYSSANVVAYPRAEFRPIALGPMLSSSPNRPTIGAIFFGCVTPRRRAILSSIGAETYDRVYGSLLVHLIRSAAIVVSIGAYDDHTNDSFRVFPAIEAGGRVVVERTQERWFNEAIGPYATIASYQELVQTCRAQLES